MEKQDFDNYVNKQWKEENPIPEKYSRWGCFESLFEETNPKIKELVSVSGRNRNLHSLFKSGMVEQVGYSNAERWLKTIKNFKSFEKTMYLLQECNIPIFFTLYASQDSKKSNIVVPHLYSGGLGLPDRDYYFDEDKKETRDMYKQYIRNLLGKYNAHSLFADIMLEKISEKIFMFEKELAKVHYTKVEKRDPHKRYNLYTYEELQKLCPNINWDEYFSTYNKNYPQNPISYIIVDNPKFFKRLSELILNFNKDNFCNQFIQYVFMNSISSMLGDDFVNLRFDFYSKFMRGQKKIKPRWERVLAVCDSALGEVIGRLYVEKYFPETSKDKMLEMVTFLHKVLKDRILNLEWMGEKTKKFALLKHNSFTNKIGYPEKWTDYSELDITNDNDNYLEKCLLCEKFNFNKELKKFYNAPDMTEWEMDPHNINAYFHPTKNEIVFPAAILQEPFFSPKYSDARNFGAIGTIIAHELTHSFDDEGRKYDHEGNLVDWWSEEDLENFMKRSDYFKDEYSSFTVNGKNVNGKLTLGENLADHGGVKIAYYALKELTENKGEEFSLDMKKDFFMAWATVWRQNISDTEADRLLTIDPHSPAHWRINGTLANVSEFRDVYKLKEGDKMFRKNIPKIW